MTAFIKISQSNQLGIHRFSTCAKCHALTHPIALLTISLRLEAANGINRGLFDVLDKFDGGVFVLDGRREVTIMNARAERLLGDGLTVSKRRLFASTADLQRALDRLISSAFDKPGESAEFGPIALSRRNGKRPLLVQALPLNSRRVPDRPEERAFGLDGALLLVVDPEQAAAVGPQECLRLLGLTAAEARLAALVGTGMRRADAAALLGVSDWTAHTTLKHIYSKLDIASQGELVRLVGRIGTVEPKRKDGG